MLSPAEVRRRYDAVRAEVGPRVMVVAATKYVTLEEMAVLAEAGIEVVGENRAQDLEAKHAAYGEAFRWHFIGRLQSNKVKVVNRVCELVHSLDSHSAAERLEVPALVQVNLAGEGSKGGVAPDELEGYLGEGVRGLSTMPPAASDPRSLASGSAGSGSWPRRTASPSSRWARRRTTTSRPRRGRRTSASAPCSSSERAPLDLERVDHARPPTGLRLRR